MAGPEQAIPCCDISRPSHPGERLGGAGAERGRHPAAAHWGPLQCGDADQDPEALQVRGPAVAPHAAFLTGGCWPHLALGAIWHSLPLAYQSTDLMSAISAGMRSTGRVRLFPPRLPTF